MTNLTDALKIESVVWDIKRNDEMSGSGDGRIYQAELAPPLWTGTVTLAAGYNDDLKAVAAMIRKLHGAQNSFLMYDPLSRYPRYDRSGVILGASVVQVATIGGDLQSFSLKGLPAGYQLAPGDKVTVSYGSNPTRFAFMEVSEATTASSSGVTPVFGVFPHVPAGLAVNAAVTLANPSCPVIIMPGSHKPGTAMGTITTGAGFTVVETKRVSAA